MSVLMVTMLSIFSAHAGTDNVNSTSGTVTVTYVANEGIFLSDGSHGVLIDALYREGVPGYAAVEPDLLEKLETAQAPFDITRLVLVTHRHRDHFDAASVVRHLERNQRASLVSSTQVVDRVEAASDELDAIKSRIHSFAQPAGTIREVQHEGIKVELFHVSHGTGRFAEIQNLGFIVTIGGRRIMHLGDAELDDGAFDPVRTFAKNVNIACVPYWWLISKTGRDFVAEALPDAHLIAIHIEPAKAKAVTARIHKFLPDATVFTEPGQLAPS